MNEQITKNLSLLDEPNKEKVETKETSKAEMTPEIFDTILSQNMGEGTFDATKVEDPEGEPEVEYKPSKEINPLGKYSDEIVKDILANPSKYKMKSPKHGEMNLKEALDKGYNPDSDEFDRKKKRSKEEITEGLSDSDKESIDKITDPKSAKIPAKEAEALGVKDPNFIAQDSEAVIPDEAVAEVPAAGSDEVPAEDPMAGLETLLGGGM